MAKRFDNKINTHRPDPNPPTVRKVPADSVLYGENVSRNGRTVWIAMEGERVVCMAATAADARQASARRHRS